MLINVNEKIYIIKKYIFFRFNANFYKRVFLMYETYLQVVQSGNIVFWWTTKTP